MPSPSTEPLRDAPPTPRTAARLRLVPDPEEITHLVCCRQTPWVQAFCGARDEDRINPVPDMICTMCVEAVEAMTSGHGPALEGICPVDAQPCPDEHEIDLRIARETDPGA
ncbi:hypothetical protein RM572_10340 [Streptomyces sp. DSM 42041]|uniref:ClpX-type ZB domain-containing protein n=1 Tax=Streptomyces hazeniae TaxID=3075538 RepID=A0ABU2NSG0_9ACTN|nr:hypothetical protein [Streptomyces sp. DSM 42041]MDT0379163.1 hypothetical protein [Streptomyces sp. DSM 42041]